MEGIYAHARGVSSHLHPIPTPYLAPARLKGSPGGSSPHPSCRPANPLATQSNGAHTGGKATVPPPQPALANRLRHVLSRSPSFHPIAPAHQTPLHPIGARIHASKSHPSRLDFAQSLLGFSQPSARLLGSLVQSASTLRRAKPPAPVISTARAASVMVNPLYSSSASVRSVPAPPFRNTASRSRERPHSLHQVSASKDIVTQLWCYMACAFTHRGPTKHFPPSRPLRLPDLVSPHHISVVKSLALRCSRPPPRKKNPIALSINASQIIRPLHNQSSPYNCGP